MSFSKNSNFNKKANFTGVKFGENKPVLEVELNELQDIQNQHREDLVRDIVLNGFTALTNIEVSTNGVKFLEETIAYVNGFRLVIPKNRVIALPSISKRKRNATINNITLEVWEDTRLSIDTLHEYGGEGNNDIPNHIIDSRYPVETSRREGIRYKFSVDSEEVTTPVVGTDLSKYETGGKTVYVLPIFTVTRTADILEYSDLRKLIQPSDIKARVEKLEDIEPLIQEYTGNKHVTVQNGFEDITKNLSIKGKTLQNLLSQDKFIKTGKLEKTTKSGRECYKILEFSWWNNVNNYKIDGVFKENTAYTIVYDFFQEQAENPGIYFRIEYTDGTGESLFAKEYDKWISKTFVTNKSKTIKYIKLTYWLATTVTYIDVDSFRLLEGDYTNKEIPNMYFDSITSTGEQEDNKIKIQSVGKNLFNYNKFDFEIDSDGYSIRNDKNLDIELKPNTTYTCNYISKLTGTVSNGMCWAFRIIDKNGNRINNQEYFDSKSTKFCQSFTTTNETKYKINFSPNNSDKTATYYIKPSTIQLEEDTKATTYEDYVKDNKEIKIPFENGLKSLPNGVCDEIINNKVIQRLGIHIFDGSKTWTKVTDKTTDNTLLFSCPMRDIVKLNNGEQGNDLLCDKFSPDTGYRVYHGVLNNEGIYISNGGNVYIRILKSKLSTENASDFMKWLQTNPVTMYYELPNPIIHKLHEDYNLSTYKDITHIMQENNICGDISFGVSKDRNALILSNTNEIRKTKEMLETTFDYLGGKVPVYVPVEMKEPVTVTDSMLGEATHLSINGFTLKNVCYNPNITLNAPNSRVVVAKKEDLKPNTIYTIFGYFSDFNFVATDESSYGVIFNNQLDKSCFTRKGYSNFKDRCAVIKLTTLSDFSNATFGLSVDAPSNLLSGTARVKVVLLEGDWTNYTIPYFDSVKSLGQDNNKITLRTTGKNLVKEVLYSKSVDTATGILNTGNYNVIDLIRVTPNATYTFSKEGVARAVNKFYYNASREYMGRSSDTNSTFTIPTDCHYIRLTFGNTTPEYNLQLEVGDKVSDFEDYRGDIVSIDIPFEGGLKSLPNGIKDIYKNGIIIQNLLKMPIPHTYDFIHYTNAPNQINTICFYMTTSILDSSWGGDWNHLYCNKFMNAPVWDNDIEGVAVDSKNKLLIRINKSKLSSLDNAGLKKWLETNELYVISKLKEPKIYEIGEPPNLAIFDRVTNIRQTNNFDTEVEMLVPVSLNKSLGRTAEENKELRSNLNTLKEGTLLLTTSMRNFMEVMMLPNDEDNEKDNPLLKSLAKLQETLNNM